MAMFFDTFGISPMPRRKQSTIARGYLTDTASASIEVIASRMQDLADPREFMSSKQMRDVSGMVSEKVLAGAQGWLAASTQLWLMPGRMAMAMMAPGSFTLAGPTQAIAEAGSLWIGVATAALAPARAKVVANRAKARKQRTR